jgi:tetratricopeptide (TPR) repeat protein
MRISKFLIILAGLFLSNHLSSQTDEGLIASADSLYKAGNYKESALTYDKALKSTGGSASDYYNAACSASLSGELDMAISFLESSARHGWKNKDWAMRDGDLEAIREMKGWDEVMELMQANLNEYEKDFDKELQAQLEGIYVRDQTLRQLYGDAINKFGSDSEEMTYFWDLVSAEDRKNEAEVMGIIDERGWPGTTLVGGKANAAVFLVIQHAPLEIQEKYLPVLKKSVMAGESRGGDLALLQDRTQMRNGQPQTYGSQIVPNPDTGEDMVYEIEAPKYVNQRRKEVGLGPIEEYLARWGISWTVEQLEK